LAVPAEWLRVHCNRNIEFCIRRNNGFDFDILKEELVPQKGKIIIPMGIQRLFVSQEILQSQAHLSLDQRCGDIFYRFKMKISPKTLSLIYKTHQVKMKMV
jgi:hypothetical protein